MANVNAPFGFKPIKSLSGGEITCSYYAVASGAARIGKGDLVTLTSSGTIARDATTASVGPWIGVALIDGGVPVAGGISKFPVCNDPAAIYEVQGSTAALALTNLNTVVKVSCGTAPNSSTGLSQNVLAVATATGSTGVRLVRFVDSPDNEVAARARLEVQLNALYSAPGTAGV